MGRAGVGPRRPIERAPGSRVAPRVTRPAALVRHAAALAAVVLFAAPARAQDAPLPPRPDGDDVCLGFAFGRWAPPLDWTLAGHGRVDSTALQRSPTGRDWATAGTVTDTTLLLLPAWWPAGVWVTIPNTPAPGDTILGRATALVADGRRTAPQAGVRAWRVACGAR